MKNQIHNIMNDKNALKAYVYFVSLKKNNIN